MARSLVSGFVRPSGAGQVHRGVRRPAAVSALSRQALEIPRRAVRAEQARLQPQLERAGARVIAGAETVANALIVEMSPDQAARVSSLAGVARVHLVRLARPYMDHALAPHKTPYAWAAIGGPANAGAVSKSASSTAASRRTITAVDTVVPYWYGVPDRIPK